MLNPDNLSSDLKTLFNNTFPEVFKQAFLATFTEKSEEGEEAAEEFGKTVDELMSESLADGIAAAIDGYIKSGAIHGTIITAGSPTTQTAMISPINMGNPTAGSVPNTLGIQ